MRWNSFEVPHPVLEEHPNCLPNIMLGLNILAGSVAPLATADTFIKNGNSLPTHFDWTTVDSQSPEADAHRLLADFLPRAFRRPIKSAEVERYVDLIKASLADGDIFEIAMCTAYKAALCSHENWRRRT